MSDNDDNALEVQDSLEEEESGRGSKLALGLFGIIALCVIIDVLHDASLGAQLEHLLVEFALMGAAILGTVMFWRRWLRERRLSKASLRAARKEAFRWQEEADRWRAEARETLRGLGKAIDDQFQRWGLSPAEQEVALLLLKGLSHKEIASIRDTSERTVRQQAASVYKKSGLGGRAELSAFFLEDLLLPSSEAG
jgi:DNA-binding CsgD family transcriptional regulator